MDFFATAARRFIGAATVCALLLLPAAASAEKNDWSDGNYNFAAVKRAVVMNVALSDGIAIDSRIVQEKMRDEYEKNSQRLKCEILTEDQARRRVSANIGIDLDALGKSDPQKADALFKENMKTVADIWVSGVVREWKNDFYIAPERTVWESKPQRRTVKDSNGNRREETYYITVPVTYPAHRVDFSRVNVSFEACDAKTGKMICGRDDNRDRDGANSQNGMFGRICKSFFDDLGKKIRR